jgi:hypothetical protein
MNVLELVLFEIKEKFSKKTLITLATLKEFVLYKAQGRDPLLAYHGNNPQKPTHTHTHTLSLSLIMLLGYPKRKCTMKFSYGGNNNSGLIIGF